MAIISAKEHRLSYTAEEIDERLDKIDKIDRLEEFSNTMVRPNLLDNWYFVNPVNQRGKTEYNFTNEYTIDRWKGRNKGVLTLDVDNECITLTSVEGYTAYFAQYVAENYASFLRGQTVTLSALVRGYARVVMHASNGDIYGDYTQCGDWTVITMTRTLSDTNTLLAASISTPYDGVSKSADIKAVKLELGSTQTLAHQDTDGNWVLNEIPDYGEELLKCCMSTADSADTYANNKKTPAAINAVNKAGGDTINGDLTIKGRSNGICLILNPITSDSGVTSAGQLVTKDDSTVVEHNNGTFSAALCLEPNNTLNELIRLRTYKNATGEVNRYTLLHTGNFSNYAVNKAGDTMTGALIASALQITDYSRALEIGRYIDMHAVGSTKDYDIRLAADGDELLVNFAGGGYKAILHTGNKPSGSYTGNGDATVRTIETGGIGHVAFIWSDYAGVLATRKGFILKGTTSTSVTGLSSGDGYFMDGKIYLTTTNGMLNSSGVTYYYQVL